MIAKDALLEIGTEELPASFVTMGIHQLHALAEASLKERGLTVGAISTYGTPRRLAVVLSGLADRSQDQTRVLSGPPVDKSKDAAGEWTPAALGFARKQGLDVSDLGVENGRLCAKMHIKGILARPLLAELFPQWISKLEFPKSMIWEPTHFRFPRPIRWLAAVYGSDLVSFNIAGVRSGKWTFGLALVSSKKIAITHPGKYVMLLKNQCVSVDPGARQTAIRKLSEQAVKRVHGTVIMSDALLEQVAQLVENPVAILGNFDPAYLSLPREVLVTCLEHHQKFFPVSHGPAADAKLLAHFVGIRNGMSVHQDIVKDGYERVLAARLADARFFYNQDRRTKLEAKVDALKGVMFQMKLGNLFDKKERVQKAIQLLADQIPGSSEWTAHALRAAELCKADLVTDVVREFPELQGIVARVYAHEDGEHAVVSAAVEEHYWPITLTGALPKSDAAAAVALIDKLDTLAGDFSVGLIPTGSADPYGLRRAAVGVIRILEERQWPVSIGALLRQAIAQLPTSVVTTPDELFGKLNQFMLQRLAALLQERGFSSDEIAAVSNVGDVDLTSLLARLNALHALRPTPEFEPLAVAFKRAMNIVRQAAKGESAKDLAVDAQKFQEPSEHALFKAMGEAQIVVKRHLAEHHYDEAFRAVVPLRKPLDDFFSGVMVMAEDAGLRANRLALMQQLVGLFSTMADFSKLQNA